MLIDLVLGYVVGMPVFDIVTDTDCVYDDEEDGDLVKGYVVGMDVLE
jgi:hypothetical protein